tara:strand:+ start:2443 stop:3087 length:645 start_codon:yes stop_codon:yes gene_type:complete
MNKKKPNLNLTDKQNEMDAAPIQEITKFRKNHSEFADLMHSTGNKAEWLVSEALAENYLQRFRVMGANTLQSGSFFQISWTHQALFYRLLKKIASCARTGDDAVGVSRKEVAQYMKLAQNKSHGAISKIISDGLAGGYIDETPWHLDARIKVLYLTPIGLTDFMDQGLENAFTATMSSALAESFLMLDKHRLENDDYEPVGKILRRFLDDKNCT